MTYIDNEPCFQRSVDDWERIWFPDGAPVFTKIKEPPLEAYDEATKENYMYLMKHGRFKDGKMPHLPPRREWTNWDF